MKHYLPLLTGMFGGACLGFSLAWHIFGTDPEKPAGRCEVCAITLDSENEHLTWYDDRGTVLGVRCGGAIFDMCQRCWSTSSIPDRLRVHANAMSRFDWAQDMRTAVIKATMEGK